METEPYLVLGARYRILNGEHRGKIGVLAQDPNDPEKRCWKPAERIGASSKYFLVLEGETAFGWFNQGGITPYNEQ